MAKATSTESIKCVVIGKNSLALECASRLFSNPNFTLVSIVSPDPQLESLAVSNNIPYYKNTDTWIQSELKTKIDYLFSIIHEDILTDEILQLPRRGAINFHDSPLPRYAGLHATSWAILNNESTHGVTWHMMSGKVDSGDIVKQKRVEILPDDTALVLNMKCYEAGLELFNELLEDLQRVYLITQPQDLSKRTYYGYTAKPPLGGIINFNDTSQNIYRSWRSMYFGHTLNDFASCKFFIGTRCFIIQEMQIKASSSDCEPGQIIEITNDHIQIATKTGDVFITSLKTLDGHPCNFLNLKKLTQLSEGDTISHHDIALMEKISSKITQLFPHERYWVDELCAINPTSFPYFSHPTTKFKITSQKKLDLEPLLSHKNQHFDWEISYLCILSIYLFRITNKNNITLGIYRPQQNTEINTSFFSDIVPLNLHFEPQDTFLDLYAQIEKKINQVTTHSTFLNDITYRYPDLTDISTSHPGIYPCLIEYINKKEPQLKSQLELTTSYFKLTIDTANREYVLALGSSKNEEIKPKELLDKIHSHLFNLLDSIKNNILTPIIAHSYLDKKEIQQLLPAKIDDTKNILNSNVIQLFKEQVNRYGNHLSIISSEHSLTYEDLDNQSNHLAAYILEHVKSPQKSIALIMNQSDTAIISMLAILKINCIYVPLNPDNPTNRLRYILKDVDAAMVLTNTQNLQVTHACTENLNIPVLNVENTEILDQYSLPTNHQVKILPDDLAYILYTSGSTGDPKGVQIYHKGIVRLVKEQNYVQFTQNDIVAQFTTLIFDVSTFEIWGALLNGSTLFIIDKTLGLEPEKLHNIIRDNCTILFMTPAVFVEVYKAEPDTFDNLRILILGGEVVRSEDVRRLLKRKEELNLNLTIINGYGPTENTTWSTYYTIDKLKPGRDSIPIGKSISYSSAYILDNYFNLLPVGVPGELYLGGLGIAKGYINHEQLTQKAFIKDPFSKGNTLYKTGDIVKMLPDGNILFISRIDSQVKIKGIRVELGEIESWLLKYHSVKQGVVVSKPIKSNRHQLIAYIVPESQHFNIVELQHYLSQHLPEYMVPLQYVIIDNFPLSPSKKIDHSKLPDPLPLDAKNYQAPRNDKEALLVKIWSQILRIKHIGRNDNFFAMGGDSIIAMQIITKAYHDGWKLKAADIFHYPCISKLAPRLKPIQSKTSNESITDTIEGNIPLTPIQHWFFESAYSMTSSFSQYVLLKLDAKPDESIIEKTFDALIQHHDILRTFYENSEGHWQQTINSIVEPFKVNHDTLASKKYDSKIAEMESKISKTYSKFKLDQPPLVRCVLFSGSNDNYLAIIAHHLVIDGVSWRIFLDDFFMAYHTYYHNKTIPLPIKSSSFKSWSKYLCEFSSSITLLNETNYWLQQSSDNEIPTDFRRGENTEKNAKTIESELDLTNISLTYKQVSARDILTTALAITLCDYFDLNEINFYMESHGRETFNSKLDLSRSMGWFTSLSPIKLSLESSQNKIQYLNMLRNVRKKIGNIPRQGIGFGLVKYLTEDLNTRKIVNDILVSSMCFNFLGNFDAGINTSDMQLVGRPIRLTDSATSLRQFLIELTAWIKNDKLHLEWKYSANYYKASTIQAVSNHYIKNINSIVSQCINSLSQTLVSHDFPLASLTQEQLSICITKYPNLENIAQLSSLQSGLLFHHLQYPDSNIYHSQYIWTDTRALDLRVFKKAWETIIKRHSIFRTTFLWKHFKSPIQIVDSTIKLPWKNYICSSLSREAKKAMINAILREDQERYFDFSDHPLMRLSIIQTNPSTYVIVWTHHHILLGASSIKNVISELYLIYHALLSDQQYYLPPAVPFSEYIAYQNQKFNHKLSKRFWIKYLNRFNSIAITKLLGEIHENTSPDFHQHEFVIPDKYASKIKKFSKSCNTSLNTVMLYAWALLISRYTDSLDISVGVAISTRPNDYFTNESIIGPLINTLPCRITLEDDEPLQQSLKRINDNILDITQHSHTALLDIYKWLKRNTQDQLFDTLFVFENYPLDFIDEHISELKVNAITHYPLVLNVYPHDKIQLVMTYNKNVICTTIIENIMTNYYHTLCEIIDDNIRNTKDIDILSITESSLLKNSWNHRKSDYPHFTITNLFTEIANLYPSKTAITYQNEKLTYDKLDKVTNRWANYLLENGLNKGDVVAVYIDRSIEMVIALLAILKAGGVYLPIDTTYPTYRVNYILDDAGAKFIFTQSSLLGIIDPKYLSLSIDILNSNLITTVYDNLPLIELSYSDLIYIIYTSGTTGLPKGIQIQHKSVINTIYSIFRELKLSSNDKLLSFTSISFDISALEIFGPLLWGMELEIASSESTKTNSSLTKLMNESSPTIIQGTPSLLFLMVNAGWKPKKGIKIISGGETLTQSLANSILAMGANLWNVYGPTETTIWSTISRVYSNKKIVIGKPIANTAIYILDQRQKIAPIGVPGELVIGGDGITPGYINRPELNKKRFIPNPYSSSVAERLYRTGDLARWLPSGELEFIDRLDNQVKIRGYRIELEEIRTILLKFTSIKDCVVLKVGDNYNEAHLKAFFTLKNPNMNFDISDLRTHLASYLPYYMIPDEFIPVEGIPINTNGKVDKEQILQLYASHHKKDIGNYNPVENPTEQLILNLFNKVLSAKNIEPNDSFFELGGNSISAIQILSNIQDCFSISLSLPDILTLQTPRQLAKAIIHKKFQNLDSYENITSPIVGLQLKGDKPPLFLIHPVGGTIFWFVKLAQYLGKDRPIYGLQDPALSTERAHFSTFEAMATFYAKEIKNIHPNGPYLLAGASFGANMAAEIAKQLIAEGKKVLFVGLLDGWAEYPDEVSTHRFLKKEMKAQYNELKKKLPEVNNNSIKPIIDFAWHRSHLLDAYSLDWIDCPLVLFKAKSTLSIFSDIESPSNHWTGRTPYLKTIIAPGNHETMFFDPNVETLAKQINTAIHDSENMGNHDSHNNAFFNDSDISYPRITVIEMFESIAEKEYSSFAAVNNGICLTYEKLNNLANQLSHYLIDLDITQGDIVGICLNRDFDLLIAILAVLKSGAAFSPINCDITPSSIDSVQLSCRAIITEKDFLRKFSTLDNKMICLDRDWQFIRLKSSDNPLIPINLDDIAIVIPTSHSQHSQTRILVSHRNISILTQWSLSQFTKEELSGVLASNHHYNEMSLFEIFPALCAGGTVHLVRDIENLSEVPFSNNITLISITPAQLNNLLYTDQLPQSVRTIILQTRSVDNAAISNIVNTSHVIKLCNAFINMEVGQLTPGLLPKPINTQTVIGKPIPNAKLVVLNKNLETLPAGSPSEMNKFGYVLCLGYLNFSDFTTEELLTNPNLQSSISNE
ncbi:MAG: amino acid adenylation domain-containing protein [Gammaproteobacteria bacterium]|nr:amino acid adenylation domain-containing protein [Gammaproteobacteria bacterium]